MTTIEARPAAASFLPMVRKAEIEAYLFASMPLWLRLPIQLALLAPIAWCTKPERRDGSSLSYYRAV